MSYKWLKNCLCCSLTVVLLLILQPSKAQQGFSKLDAWLEEHVSSLGGRAVLMIYKDGNIVYNRAENELSRKQKIKGKIIARKTGKNADDILKDYDADTKIGIASCSKWLTAALAMTFIDDGSLRLTDTVGKFIPATSKHGMGKITIEQCLSHTTGIATKGLKENQEMLKSGSMDASIDYIMALGLEDEPGTSFHYGGVGLQIAAAVIEKISGKDFKTVFNERIAIPCGMLQTDFGTGPVALAGGGARSTAGDYLNFLAMILQDGTFKGKTVLSKKSVELMQYNYARGKKIKGSPAEAGNWGYGFGEWVIEGSVDGKRAKSVSSPGLFGSFPWVDNHKKYAAILFTFNLKNKGRHDKYISLKKLVDDMF